MIVGKSNGEPRRVIDFQARETHHTNHQARDIPSVRRLERISFRPRGHPLQEDTHFTTFITAWAAPQGYRYTARFDNLVEDVCRRHSDMT